MKHKYSIFSPDTFTVGNKTTESHFIYMQIDTHQSTTHTLLLPGMCVCVHVFVHVCLCMCVCVSVSGEAALPALSEGAILSCCFPAR